MLIVGLQKGLEEYGTPCGQYFVQNKMMPGFLVKLIIFDIFRVFFFTFITPLWQAWVTKPVMIRSVIILAHLLQFIITHYYMACVYGRYKERSDWLILGHYSPVMPTDQLQACKAKQNAI